MDYTITISLDGIAERLGITPERALELTQDHDAILDEELEDALENILSDHVPGGCDYEGE